MAGFGGVNARLRQRLLVWLNPFVAMRPASRRMALALFLWGMGEGLWMFVRPLYVADLGGNPAQAGQVLATAGLAPMLLMLPAGRLVDRIGPRRLLVVLWWVGTLAAALLALAPDWRWLIPGFFMYSTSAAAIPAVDAYLARDVWQSRSDPMGAAQAVQSVISAVFAAYFAGTIFSPMIGGWVGEQFGLRSVFWVSGIWFVLSTLVIHSLPGLPDYHQTIAADPGSGGRPWWRFSVGQVRIYLTLLALFFFIALGYALVPTFVESERGLPVGTVGSLGTATALGGVVWMLALGGHHSRRALSLAGGLLALAFGGLLLIPVGPLLLPGLVLVYFLLGVYLTVRTLALGVATEYAPPAHHGTAFGMVETMFGVGAFAGPWAAGLLYTHAPAQPFIVALVALVPLAGLVYVLLRPAAEQRRHKNAPEQDAPGVIVQ